MSAPGRAPVRAALQVGRWVSCWPTTGSALPQRLTPEPEQAEAQAVPAAAVSARAAGAGRRLVRRGTRRCRSTG